MMTTTRRAQAYLVPYRAGDTQRPERSVFLDADRATQYAANHHGSVHPLQEQITVTIAQCKNPTAWYSSKVGMTFAVLAVDSAGIWTRGDDGFVNVIDWRDI